MIVGLLFSKVILLSMFGYSNITWTKLIFKSNSYNFMYKSPSTFFKLIRKLEDFNFFKNLPPLIGHLVVGSTLQSFCLCNFWNKRYTCTSYTAIIRRSFENQLIWNSAGKSLCQKDCIANGLLKTSQHFQKFLEHLWDSCFCRFSL